ncbi:MAG: TIGR02450 family Trp-rich protein, partial [Synechococcus sp. TMED155]
MTKLASHWTSSAPQLGCRHFRVVTVGGKGSERWVELEPLLKPSLRLRLKL